MVCKFEIETQLLFLFRCSEKESNWNLFKILSHFLKKLHHQRFQFLNKINGLIICENIFDFDLQ